MSRTISIIGSKLRLRSQVPAARGLAQGLRPKMPREAVSTDKAPKPLPGIYSQAIVANGFVYCSGQVPMDPAISKLIDGDIQAHTHQCIKNLAAVLDAAGSSLDQCVEVNVFLADMADFAKMNEVYKTYFGELKPARTCVAVKTLPLNTDVEIKCIAVVSDKASRL